MNKRAKKFCVLIAIGLAFALLMSFWSDLYGAKDATTVFKILCDCFTVPAILYLGFGLLLWSGNEGTFDMLGYGVKSFFGMFSHKSRQEKESFYDYRQRKHAQQKVFAEYLWAGLVFLAIALILLFVYYQL